MEYTWNTTKEGGVGVTGKLVQTGSGEFPLLYAKDLDWTNVNVGNGITLKTTDDLLNYISKIDQSKSYTCTIYIVSETKPDKPTGGSYNFETETFIAPQGWSVNIPSSESKIWFSYGTIFKDGTTQWGDPCLYLTSFGLQNKQNSVTIYKAVKEDQNIDFPEGGFLQYNPDKFTPPYSWSITPQLAIDKYQESVVNISDKQKYKVYVSYNTYNVNIEGDNYGQQSNIGWTAPIVYDESLNSDDIAAAIAAKSLNINNTTYLQSDGDVYFAQGEGKSGSRFYNDGRGSLAGGNITWNQHGNAEFNGNITANSMTVEGKDYDTIPSSGKMWFTNYASAKRISRGIIQNSTVELEDDDPVILFKRTKDGLDSFFVLNPLQLSNGVSTNSSIKVFTNNTINISGHRDNSLNKYVISVFGDIIKPYLSNEGSKNHIVRKTVTLNGDSGSTTVNAYGISTDGEHIRSGNVCFSANMLNKSCFVKEDSSKTYYKGSSLFDISIYSLLDLTILDQYDFGDSYVPVKYNSRSDFATIELIRYDFSESWEDYIYDNDLEDEYVEIFNNNPDLSNSYRSLTISKIYLVPCFNIVPYGDSYVFKSTGKYKICNSKEISSSNFINGIYIQNDQIIGFLKESGNGTYEYNVLKCIDTTGISNAYSADSYTYEDLNAAFNWSQFKTVLSYDKLNGRNDFSDTVSYSTQVPPMNGNDYVFLRD